MGGSTDGFNAIGAKDMILVQLQHNGTVIRAMTYGGFENSAV